MRKVHYGWVMVVATFAVLACTAGQINCYGLLVVPVCEELGIPRSAMGLSQSLTNIGGIVVPMFAGIIFTRLKLKRLMLVAAITMNLSFLSISFANNITQICVAMVIESLSFALVTWMPFSILMNTWFHKKRGLAMGLAFMGSGIGGMLFSALGGSLIAAAGWRTMVRAFCLIAACVNLPVILFVIKEKPEDVGLLPYGMENAPEGAQESLTSYGAKLSDERKKPLLWTLLFCTLMVCFVMNGIGATMAAYAQDSGYSGTVSAGITAGYLCALALAKIVLGIAFDRRGARAGVFLSLSLLAVCLISLLLIRIPVFIIGVVIGGGMGVSFNTIALPIMARHTFGNREYSAFTGMFTSANAIGGLLAPTVIGSICDATGSYAAAYGISVAIVLVFGTILILKLPKKAVQ